MLNGDSIIYFSPFVQEAEKVQAEKRFQRWTQPVSCWETEAGLLSPRTNVIGRKTYNEADDWSSNYWRARVIGQKVNKELLWLD